MQGITKKLRVGTGMMVYGVFWAVAVVLGHLGLFEWGKKRLITAFSLETALLTPNQRENGYGGEVPIFFAEKRDRARVVLLALFGVILIGKTSQAAAALEAIAEEEVPSVTVERGETSLRQVAARLVGCPKDSNCQDQIDNQTRQLELFNQAFLEQRGVECRTGQSSLRGKDWCLEGADEANSSNAEVGAQSLREGDNLRLR